MTDWDGARALFDRAAVAHVATLLRDGSPHSVPVWVGVEGDSLAFFMLDGSTKDRNLRRDPRVALSITDPDEPLRMAAVRGRAETRLEGDAAQRIVDRLAVKYTGKPYFQRSGNVAYLVTPESAWAQDYSGD
jgi:PPOX class probable F420-dependent enzyme